MRREEQADKRTPVTVFIYAFGMFLLLEWLWPLQQMAHVTGLSGFIIFAALCFLLLFLRVRWYAAVFLQGTALLVLTQMEYSNAYREEMSWVSGFTADVQSSIRLLLKGQWQDSSVVVQTVAFFLLIWLISYVFSWSMVRNRRVLLLFFATVTYVAAVDTFTAYIGKWAMIRLIVLGFFMLGVLGAERVLRREGMSLQAIRLPGLLLPLAVCITAAAAAGYAAPKLKPQWPDPVPYFTSKKSEEKGSGSQTAMSTVGYSEDDSRLGGPLRGDNTVVFTTKGTQPQYWRVETRTVYTGKGWDIFMLEGNEMLSPQSPAMMLYEEGVPTESAKASVALKRPAYSFLHLVYPGGLQSVSGGEGIYFSLNPETGRISVRPSEGRTMDKYDVTYAVPKFPIEKLQAVKDGTGLEAPVSIDSLNLPEDEKKAWGEAAVDGMLPSSFLMNYTWLPELPQRVRDLAAQLTAGKTNRYDKAVAIEEYLRGPQFTYEKENIPYPAPEQDYVDQFLFETKKGYCNNFSTAMVVLLRAAGIPSRWVKGYTEGEFQSIDPETGEQVFKVTNNNAHSWVEVYFPGYGWVPFEPTKGFASPYSFVNETQTSTAVQSTPAAPPASVQQAQQKQTAAEKQLQEEDVAGKKAATAPTGRAWSWKELLLYSAAALLLGLGLWNTRVHWYGLLGILLYRSRRDEKAYFRAYTALLRQLARAGLKRDAGQTLREYAARVEQFERFKGMTELTRSYERAVYRHDAEAEWEKSAALWTRLMKQTARGKAS